MAEIQFGSRGYSHRRKAPNQWRQRFGIMYFIQRECRAICAMYRGVRSAYWALLLLAADRLYRTVEIISWFSECPVRGLACPTLLHNWEPLSGLGRNSLHQLRPIPLSRHATHDTSSALYSFVCSNWMMSATNLFFAQLKYIVIGQKPARFVLEYGQKVPTSQPVYHTLT